MAVVVVGPEVAHAAAATGGGEPLHAADKEEAPLAEVVPVAEGEKGAAARVEGSPAAIVGDKGGGGLVEVARKGGEPPVDGGPASVDAFWKGASAADEAAQGAIKTDGEADGEAEVDDDVGERKVEAKVAEEEEEVEVEEEEEVVVEEEEAGEEKWLRHYSSMHSILIVGDGDFSFSLALATAFGSGTNLVATTLDTYEASMRKYSKAESNIMELKRLGATVLHGVNAETMMFHTDLKNRRFDRIVFNFPHAGFKGKEDDLHMINSHKELMWYFFCNARRLLRRYGEIHVTHKTGYPYDRWDLKHLAADCSLVLVMKVGFRKEDYPGYNQKRGDGSRCDKPFDLASACTFKFQIGDLKKLKKLKGNRARSKSNLGGSNLHHGQWATDAVPFHPHTPVGSRSPQRGQWASGRGQFHQLPPVEAWPPQHFPPPANSGHIPLHPHVAYERQHTGFLRNPDGMVGDPYFHEHDTFCPRSSMPGSAVNDLPALVGIPPRMGRITYPNHLPPPEQPWYDHPRTISDPPERDDHSFLAQEYHRSLQRESDLGRHLVPGSTSSSFLGALSNGVCHEAGVAAQQDRFARSAVKGHGWGPGEGYVHLPRGLIESRLTPRL